MARSASADEIAVMLDRREKKSGIDRAWSSISAVEIFPSRYIASILWARSLVCSSSASWAAPRSERVATSFSCSSLSAWAAALYSSAAISASLSSWSSSAFSCSSLACFAKSAVRNASVRGSTALGIAEGSGVAEVSPGAA